MKGMKTVASITAAIMLAASMAGCGSEPKDGGASEEKNVTEITEPEKPDNDVKEEKPTGHTAEKIERKDATCESAGHREYWACAECGGKYADEACTKELSAAEIEIAAYGHEYGERIEEKGASCTEDGREYRECRRCGKRTDEKEITATGHEWGEKITVRAATCEREGITERICGKCGETKREETEKTEHTYETRIKYPTCEENGYTEHECTKCGYRYTDGETEKTGHVTETERIDPTCVRAGKEITRCRVCGEKTEKELAATGHEYRERTVKADCENDGYTEHECVKCGYRYTDGETEKTGHDYGEWETVTAPTCTEGGNERRTCGACGASEERETSARGHGIENGECKECGYREPMEYEPNGDGTYTLIGIGEYTGDEIKVPNEYNGGAVTRIADGAFKNNADIKRAVIGKNVVYIGKEAFYGCKNMTSAEFEAPSGWYTAATGSAKNGTNIDVAKSASRNADNLVGTVYGKLFWLKK